MVDAEPNDMAALADLPTACQWCDPRRPTTHVQSGPRHHRWEFMLLPGERPEDFDDPERVWSLLEPWYRPDDGPLTRTAVYEFRSMLAERMRAGRALLVGDAAHLTPPFLGQGLCSGLRDAANLAWKLDLVLRGLAPDALLDTVEAERQPQTEWVIRFAIELGKVLCELDPKAAAERDATVRGADAPPPPVEFPPLQDGVIHRAPDGSPDPLAGTLERPGPGRGRWARRALRRRRRPRLGADRGRRRSARDSRRRAARRARRARRDGRLAGPRRARRRRRRRRPPDRLARPTTARMPCSFVPTSTSSAASPRATSCRRWSATCGRSWRSKPNP